MTGRWEQSSGAQNSYSHAEAVLNERATSCTLTVTRYLLFLAFPIFHTMLSSRFAITHTKWYDRSEDRASVRHGQTVPRSSDLRSTVSVLISSSQLILALRRTDKKTCT
ncbi:hypothetical protein ARMGADRAFT_91692 [Armillaria gallica]|uniref:Uncharacterized protein n=1 Tax=Armillaria gallica TaxID=47427 RepID=A0A2H3DUE2_ARMGA|nr:hypothetical protein ARMGADRAFT_91692 [Armillaria gallica]